MNKQSNIYTIIYIVVMVVIVGAALAYASMSLRDRQKENEDADKMKQILASVHIVSDDSQIKDEFDKYIVEQFVINTSGDKISDDAFGVDMAEEVKIKDYAKRQLPVYVCQLNDKDTKYILPVYGAGLWGPIWGYVALDSNGSTVYGAYFSHQNETPGLGAEIAKPAFSDQFDGKNLFKDGQFHSIAVVKKGQMPPNGEDYVDGISGGTITSKGVNAMLEDCLTPYNAFLENLRNK